MHVGLWASLCVKPFAPEVDSFGRIRFVGLDDQELKGR